MDVMSRIRELLDKKSQKRKSSFEEIKNFKKLRMSELNGDDYQGDLHNNDIGIYIHSTASMRNHMRGSESFTPNNSKTGFLNSIMYNRSQTNDRNAPNLNYNFGNMDGKFKQPMAPLSNGPKRLPALLSASNCSLNLNKPQETINPHFSKYGELSELSNFKSVPDLYPINRTNANVSQSTSGGLVNGHEHSSMFLSSKYGSKLNPSSQSMLNNSNIGSTHSILGTSKYFNNNSSTKTLGLKGSSLYSNSGQMMPPSNLSLSRYQSLLDMIPGLKFLKKSKKNTINDSSIQGIIDLSDEHDVRRNKTTNSSSSPPNVDRVNSLKTRLETKEVFGDKWETVLNEKYSSKQLSRRDSLQQVQEENEECERKTRESEERLRDSFKKITISSIIYDEEEEEEPVNDYPPLDDEKVRKIHQLMSGRDSGTVLITKFNLSVTRHDIQTLQWHPLTWLNDEVINFYMELLSERSRRNNDKLPKVHGMNTFFLKRLLENGYSGVRRWTRKVDLFAHDIIPIPVHKGIHWCMAIIHIKNKTIKYYDSMGAPNNQVLSALFEYLKAESLDKKKVDLDMTGWKTENVRNIPQQENGSDCGVFSCMYAEFVTRNRPIVFTQQHMQYFRMKMVYEICTGQMLN